MMANFFNMRGWLVVDAQKYNKDMQLLKDYKTGWAHVSPTVTLSEVLRTLASNGNNVDNQQVVAETPRPDQLKQWSKIFSYLLVQVISGFNVNIRLHAVGKMVEDAAETRQLDPLEKTMGSFLSGRGWVIVDGSKYRRDMQILKEHRLGWSHVSPNETLTDVLSIRDAEIS